jgi:integrase
MASINFRTKGKNKPNASVYITFRNGRNCSLEIKSGITIPNSDWLTQPDPKGNTKRKGEHKTRNIAAFENQLEVQKKLDDLRSAITKELSKTSEYTKDWLQRIVNKFNGIDDEVEDTEPTLVEMIDRYIEYITYRASETREQGTIKTYKLTKMRVEKFDAYKEHSHLVGEVGVLFQGDFIRWARSVEKYSLATFLKSAKQIKTVIRYAKRIGLAVDETLLTDTDSLEIPKKKKKQSEDVNPIFLNRSEIDRLMAFEGPDHLENVRDWLVVSCWSACRISDFMELTEDNIQTTIKGEKVIRYVAQKNGDPITLPIHYQLAEIIARHNGGFPRTLSKQKYNQYIKELCKRVGITEKVKGSKQKKVFVNGKEEKRSVTEVYPKYELVVSHIGRRSFVTNYYGIIPTNLLMLITGHDTLKDFLTYIGEEPEDHVSEIYEYFKKEEQKATNQKIAK